jgi:hypothetical protein
MVETVAEAGQVLRLGGTPEQAAEKVAEDDKANLRR